MRFAHYVESLDLAGLTGELAAAPELRQTLQTYARKVGVLKE